MLHLIKQYCAFYKGYPCLLTSSQTDIHIFNNIYLLIADFVLALTSSGCVLSRSVNRNESAELVEIDNDCIKLVQVGNRCFGFFKGIDQTITVKCVYI